MKPTDEEKKEIEINIINIQANWFMGYFQRQAMKVINKK